MLKLVVIFACLGVSIVNGFAILDRRIDLESVKEEVGSKLEAKELPRPEESLDHLPARIPSPQQDAPPPPGPPNPPPPKESHKIPSPPQTKTEKLQASPDVNGSNSKLANDSSFSDFFARLAEYYKYAEGTY